MIFKRKDDLFDENEDMTTENLEDDEDFIISREEVSSKEKHLEDEPEEEGQEEEGQEEELQEDEETLETSEESQNDDGNQEENIKTEETETEECETEVVEEKPEEENKYLDMARQIQADFDNFRRHAEENVKKAKIDGQASVIEVFLPCLDTFKEAKKSITDENVMKGVEMIEEKIMDTLKSLGVEKLPSIGQVYDPHIHNVIAVMRNDEKENDIILDEYQAGYKFNGKVLRYAKVIVNKL